MVDDLVDSCEQRMRFEVMALCELGALCRFELLHGFAVAPTLLGVATKLQSRAAGAAPVKAVAAMSNAPEPEIKIMEGAKAVLNEPGVVVTAGKAASSGHRRPSRPSKDYSGFINAGGLQNGAVVIADKGYDANSIRTHIRLSSYRHAF